MTCPTCGRYAPPDPETGYDGDEICPSCADLGWQECADGTLEQVDLVEKPDPETDELIALWREMHEGRR